MSFFIDTSVLVAAMIESEDFHEPCRAVVVKGEANMYSHGITETFSTLTGGKKTFRLSAAVAAEFLDDHFVPRLTISTLTPTEILRAMREAETRGVRGGAIFDFLHLVAARKAKAARFYTLNIAHFRAFHRSGDPEIAHP
jgi:predicted nucleic acid-binding protein